jgi:hypothetical protein
MLLKSLDFTLHQLFLNSFQSTQSSIVASQKLVELIDVSHVVFFL